MQFAQTNSSSEGVAGPSNEASIDSRALSFFCRCNRISRQHLSHSLSACALRLKGSQQRRVSLECPLELRAVLKRTTEIRYRMRLIVGR